MEGERRGEGRTDGRTDRRTEGSQEQATGGRLHRRADPRPPPPSGSLWKLDRGGLAQVPRESPPWGCDGLAPPGASKVGPKIVTLSSAQPSCTGQRPAVRLTPSEPGLGRSRGGHLYVPALPPMPARPRGDPGGAQGPGAGGPAGWRAFRVHSGRVSCVQLALKGDSLPSARLPKHRHTSYSAPLLGLCHTGSLSDLPYRAPQHGGSEHVNPSTQGAHSWGRPGEGQLATGTAAQAAVPSPHGGPLAGHRPPVALRGRRQRLLSRSGHLDVSSKVPGLAAGALATLPPLPREADFQKHPRDAPLREHAAHGGPEATGANTAVSQPGDPPGRTWRRLFDFPHSVLTTVDGAGKSH